MSVCPDFDNSVVGDIFTDAAKLHGIAQKKHLSSRDAHVFKELFVKVAGLLVKVFEEISDAHDADCVLMTVSAFPLDKYFAVGGVADSNPAGVVSTGTNKCVQPHLGRPLVEIVGYDATGSKQNEKEDSNY